MKGVQPQGVTTGSAAAAPTRQLWTACPESELFFGQLRGWYLWEDFINFPDLSAVDADLHGWSVVSDTGGTVKQLADEVGGVYDIKADTDNETSAIGTGGNAGGFVKLDADHRVWFEARWKVNTIANTTFGAFVGLCEEGLVVVDGLIAAAATLVDKDYIGFWRNEADGDNIDIVFNKESGANPTTLEADAKVLVADTYIKTGFLWDPTNRQDRYLEVFIDGVRETQDAYTNVGSAANTVDDTTNFPGGEELGVILFNEAGATPGNLQVDWVKCAAMPIT